MKISGSRSRGVKGRSKGSKGVHSCGLSGQRGHDDSTYMSGLTRSWDGQLHLLEWMEVGDGVGFDAIVACEWVCVKMKERW